jgi:hypothetical protein
VIRSLATLAKSKVAIAATAAALAAGGGVGAKAAVTGNPNPFNWGHQVKDQVVTCKQGPSAGQHGIGACVSDFAKRHGLQVHQEHSRAGSHSTGPPTSHPTRRAPAQALLRWPATYTSEAPRSIEAAPPMP